MTKAQAEAMRSKRGETQITAIFEPANALNQLEPMLQASNKWLEGWMAMSSEILEFGKSRLDRNLEMSKAIARSGSIDEAMDLQANYTRTVVRDYFSEASKLADLGTRAIFDSLWIWQPAMRSSESSPRPTAA
jgi:hypothetical protein